MLFLHEIVINCLVFFSSLSSKVFFTRFASSSDILASTRPPTPMTPAYFPSFRTGYSDPGYSSALTSSHPDLILPAMFFVSSKPMLSALIHLCLNPSGAGGASKDDGGVQVVGFFPFLLFDSREKFYFIIFHTLIPPSRLIVLRTLRVALPIF